MTQADHLYILSTLSQQACFNTLAGHRTFSDSGTACNSCEINTNYGPISSTPCTHAISWASIVGDTLYATPEQQLVPRLCLHAKQLSFNHPVTAETLTFDCPVPF